ncbi:translation initiation factor IF-3, partial [Candidatus Woesebacteria bacterium RIFCSPHIGHO2_01_FULL_44_21]
MGLMSRDEAIAIAEKSGIDLVEIAPNANPPVAKIIEIGKFLYIEEKKSREQKKKAKAAELKEVRFSPFIAEGDYNTRIRKIDDYLEHKH